MPKRQIILLGFMGLALAFGLFNLLTAGSTGAASTVVVDVNLDAVTAAVKTAMDKEQLTEIEAYRLARVGGDLFADPFLRTSGDSDQVLEEAVQTMDAGGARFAYSGLIALGDSRLAIINDSEYKSGEVVGDTGFTLTDIRPDAVVLEGRNPESGALENVVVPIQDDLINFAEGDDAKN